MDDTDRKLLMLLISNPRMHLQELATRLGVSKQAVHRRIGYLKEIGVIQSMTAGISYPYLDAIPVAVFGPVRTAPCEKMLDGLGECEFTRRVVVAGGNYLYAVGELRDLSELDGFAEFVRRTSGMSEATVGIFCLDDGLWKDYPVDGIMKRKQNYRELSALDLRIIASIKDDARKPIEEIADMVGVSPKTVRKHLEIMVSEGSLEMHTRTDSYLGGDICLIGHVNLRVGSDKAEVAKRLLSKHQFQDAYFRTFVNIPGLLTLVFWSDKMAEIREVISMISEDGDVVSVMMNFSYLQRLYATWRDKMPEVQTRHCTNIGEHSPHSRLRAKHPRTTN
jgi:DNA-binding Lrp family transcriptional regulator